MTIFQTVSNHALSSPLDMKNGLHSLGFIKETDFKWTSFIFHAFAVAIFQENLRHLKPYDDSNKEYEEGIRFMTSKFAQILEI